MEKLQKAIVIERQISWPTIRDHREKHGAKYSVIVGPAFAGGDLMRRANDFKTLLIDTKTLIKLLKIHSKTTISLIDFEEIFSKIGFLNLEDCNKMMRKKGEYEKQLDLIPKILVNLQELQAQNETTTINVLRWSLNRKYSNKEISHALELLRILEIVKISEREEYVTILNPDVAALKLQQLRNSIVK